MPTTLIRSFIYSAGALLLAAASALFMTNWANAGFGSAHDPIFSVTIRNLFWIVGGVELAVALICLFGRRIFLQLALVLWLSINLIVYRFGTAGGFRGSIGNLSDVFGISADTADDLLKILVLCLLTGSFLSLLWLWMQKKSDDANGYLKTSCSSCGGHIRFATQNLGQKIACPHCQKETTLRKSDLLKMSCFFCMEHIEFPTHALGQKINCPHCKMNITLKESA
jgi:DNA-directed RNA polymerase subunit RPC12/RpoP